MGKLKSTPDYRLITSAVVAIVAGLVFAFLMNQWLSVDSPDGGAAESPEFPMTAADEDLDGYEVLPIRAPAAPPIAADEIETVTTDTESEKRAEEELAPCPGDERKPIRLFGDAQVRPSYTLRTMHGVQIQGVREDSFWGELGIDSGDLIIEQDGRLINSPQASVDLMNYLERSATIRLKIRTTEGNDRWIDWEAPQPPDPATLPPHCR